MDTDLIKKIVKLDKQLKALKEAAEKLDNKRRDIESAILDQMATEGVDSIKVDGATVYSHRMLWAKINNKDKAIRALREIGLGEFTSETINSNRLSAYLRELDKDETPIPEALQDSVSTSEVFSVRTRR